MGGRFIIAQLFGILGLITVFISFQCKRNKVLFLVQMLSNICCGISLFILDGMSGMASIAFICIRCFLLAFPEYKWASWRGWVVLLIAVNFITTIKTWDGLLSILPFIAVSVMTIVCWSQDPKKIRFFQLFLNSPLWIVYHGFTGAYANILTEVVCMISVVIYIKRAGWFKRNAG